MYYNTVFLHNDSIYIQTYKQLVLDLKPTQASNRIEIFLMDDASFVIYERKLR